MNGDLHSPSTLQQPTRVRYRVLGFACALSMITYLDRVCVASAKPDLMKALGLSSVGDLKWVFSSFSLAYALFEIPSGWLGDMFGPRLVLLRIVLWWSVFTALTGLAGFPIGPIQIGYWSLVAIRFLFGMGEAGAYPNITRALHNWFPFHQRGLAQGAVWMSGRLMGGLTPLLWLLVVEGLKPMQDDGDSNEAAIYLIQPLIHWRTAFWMFGILGAIWCVLFAWWFRNRPEEKKGVNAAELAMIQEGRQPSGDSHSGVPWMRLLKSGNLWALCFMYFCASYAWYFNITYLPSYLEGQYHIKNQGMIGALYAGGPLWMGALACLGGGWLTDWFIRRTGSRRWGRSLFGIVGHGLCAGCYLLCLTTNTALSFFLALSFAAFWNDLTMGASWAACQDIGEKYAATVAGCMNTIGNLGGAVSTWVIGDILQRSLNGYAAAQGKAVEALNETEKAAGLVAGYHTNLITFAIVYGIAVLLWFKIDASRPVVAEE